jgi:hypothetical protein
MGRELHLHLHRQQTDRCVRRYPQYYKNMIRSAQQFLDRIEVEAVEDHGYVRLLVAHSHLWPFEQGYMRLAIGFDFMATMRAAQSRVHSRSRASRMSSLQHCVCGSTVETVARPARGGLSIQGSEYVTAGSFRDIHGCDLATSLLPCATMNLGGRLGKWPNSSSYLFPFFHVRTMNGSHSLSPCHLLATTNSLS